MGSLFPCLLLKGRQCERDGGWVKECPESKERSGGFTFARRKLWWRSLLGGQWPPHTKSQKASHSLIKCPETRNSLLQLLTYYTGNCNFVQVNLWWLSQYARAAIDFIDSPAGVLCWDGVTSWLADVDLSSWWKSSPYGIWHLLKYFPHLSIVLQIRNLQAILNQSWPANPKEKSKGWAEARTPCLRKHTR